MPGAVTSVTWNTKSATPTGVDALGVQTFASTATPASGVYYPDRRTVALSGATPGFLVEFDSVLISETFFAGKEGDTVLVGSNLFVCVGAEVFTLPFVDKPSHAEYALKLVGEKAVVS